MNVDQILSLVAEEYKVKVSDIKGDKRDRSLPEARRMVLKLLKEQELKEGHEKINYSEMGQTINMHPSNVPGRIRMVEEEITRYQDTRKHFENILKRL